MKILHVIFSLRTGGAETMLVDLANQQAAEGHDVSLLIVNDDVDPYLAGKLSPEVKVSYFGRRPGANPLPLFFRLNGFLLRKRPDVIHAHSIKLPALMRVMRGRVLYTVHALAIPMGYVKGIRKAAISEAVRADVLARDPKSQVTTVENGIVADDIASRGDRGLGHPVKIVQVGRLAYDLKGQDILIDALVLLRRRGVDATVTFIGDGEDMQALRERARDAGVEDSVVFEGLRTRGQIYPHLKDFDIMCHPSRFEGFGLTVAEGLVAGLPLVVPEGGGPWEVAGKGRFCTSFASGDPVACADALESVISGYPAALNQARLGREYVLDRFTVRRMVREYVELYRTLRR